MNALRTPRCWRAVRLNAVSQSSYRIPRTTSLRLPSRSFQHLAPNKPPEPPNKVSPPVTAPGKKPPGSSEDAAHISISQQRRNDWAIIKRLSANLWPKDDWSTKARVVTGMGLLVAGKVCAQAELLRIYLIRAVQLLNVQVPLLFKNIIDTLNIPVTDDSTVWIVCGSLVLGCKSSRAAWH